MIVPKRMSNPMFWIMFPNPFWISIIISIGLIPISIANNKDALNKTKKGWSLTFEVPITIQKMVMKMEKSENNIVFNINKMILL